jgi:hypothetical protein
MEIWIEICVLIISAFTIFLLLIISAFLEKSWDVTERSMNFAEIGQYFLSLHFFTWQNKNSPPCYLISPVKTTQNFNS